MMEKKMFLAGIIVFLFLGIVVFIDDEILARSEVEGQLNMGEYFYDGDFVLSVAPGFHDEEFYLTVSIPSIPHATIYWTIDGTEPEPGEADFITWGDNDIQVSGELERNGQIFVEDRTTDWRNAILMYHSEDWVCDNPNRHRDGTLPVDDVEILQGTAFRFRGFINDVPVTETVTATYIIEANASTRFNGVPVVAITAPYEDFLYIYGNTGTDSIYRRIFNYEYFTYVREEEYADEGYVRRFNLLGSSSLGGSHSRTNEQRTINVSFSRGDLDGVVTYPIFGDLEELYRVRLWNGGNGFNSRHMADNFVQTASSNLNALFSDSQLAVKFINGEFWGFTVVREHTSNEDFISTQTGLDRGNIIITNRLQTIDVIVEGNEGIGKLFLEELSLFTTQADMSTDEALERLFDEFFDQKNFIDFLIANTFFHNSDWPHNNVRMFRVINPNPALNTPYNDGKWRFILHDMDQAPGRGGSRRSDSNFSTLYERHTRSAEGVNYYFLVFNNPTFVRKFVNRSNYVLEHYFYPERLLSLHNEFLEAYRPLLVDMYDRFNIHGSPTESLENFERCAQHLERFLRTRSYFYRQQLDYLLGRVGLEF